MPEFSQEVNFTSDKSSLKPGMHPACLLLVTEEPIPEGWAMRDRGQTHMYRWHFAIWDYETSIAGAVPEHQTAVSSKTFSPGGKNPASKAFVWTSKLLGRRPNQGERVNLDPLMPLPCLLEVDRMKNDGAPIDYARITDLKSWAEGDQFLTPPVRAKLQALMAEWAASSHAQLAEAQPAPVIRAAIPPVPPTANATNPTMVGWGNPAGAVKPPPTAPSW